MKKKIKIITALSLSTLALGALAACSDAPVVNEEDNVSVQLSNGQSTGRTIYVSPDGVSANDGLDPANPTTFDKAHKNALAGDVILLNEGTYRYTERQNLGVREEGSTAPVVTGTYDNYITIMPNPSNTEKVLFDFSGMVFADANRGIQVYSDYWYIKDIEVYGAGDNGMYIAGNHNIIENCLFYGNRDTGLQLGRSYSSNTTVDSWPNCNLIKNCTSFCNYDYGTFGENADGFAAKLTVGEGNIFDGCIAARNSDDGWDLFAKVDSGDIGTVILYNCVSFENGFLPFKHFKEGQDMTKPADQLVQTYDTLNGDGIGFKLGGSTMRGNVIVKNSMAFDNKLHGIGDNSNPGVLQVSNFTAFNNCSGVNTDGTISDVRGIQEGNVTNKSNNIDLARSIESYNSYYGILSYINNQKNYTTANDSSYNKDAFRGSAAYSIFNTGYNNGEKYVAFTGWEDASSYVTATDDIAFSSGTAFDRGLSDSDFKDLAPINAKINMNIDGNQYSVNYEDTIQVESFRDNLAAMTTQIHTNYRNAADHSVNMGDHLALNSQDLLTYAEGNPIGAVLNKSSYAEYDHYDEIDFYNDDYEDLTQDDVNVKSALSICEAITRYDATYQDFKLPKLLHNSDISWTSSNPDVVSIEYSEEYSVSWSAFSWARITVPENDTIVTLTATATSGKTSESKEIQITVKGRNQTLGDIVSTGDTVIRVNKYGSFIAPRLYPTDNSSIVVSELPKSIYDMTYDVKYAVSGNSKFYKIGEGVSSVEECVSTSVPGVYEITATATLKSDSKYTRSFTYRVYVVDPDCDIDFVGTPTVTLSQDGFVVTGNLSNIEGNVIGVYSTTQLNVSTAADLLAQPNVQYIKITTDSIVAQFEADNEAITSGATQYYYYYAVVNANESNASDNAVRSGQIKVVNISSEEQFNNIAKAKTSLDVTTIYSLTKDLDFSSTEYTYNSTSAFKGLFRGNGHTISNITIDDTANDSSTKSVNIITKVEDGTVMDVYFENIVIKGGSNSKQLGIIGELNGGYVYNVHAHNITVSGLSGCGAIVGQVTGGINYVSQCSLTNPYGDYMQYVETNDDGDSYFNIGLESYIDSLPYTISAINKYAGGIIGDYQENSTLRDSGVPISLYLNNCYVDAVIGNGKDAGGNTSSILGRIKNDTTLYYSEITNNIVKGLVVSNGQYNAGIVGNIEAGSGAVIIKNNISEVDIMYKELYYGAEYCRLHGWLNKYAHKNSNAIVGRAVTNPYGYYEAYDNYGLWGEYYSSQIGSTSMVYDMYDQEHYCPMNVSDILMKNIGFDVTNTWKHIEATYSDDEYKPVCLTRYKAYLKAIEKYYQS